MQNGLRLLALLIAGFTSSAVVAQRAMPTPIAKLLVAPEQVQGQLVSVVGVMGRPAVGGYAVYLDRGSHQHDVTVSSVWLRFGNEAAEREATSAIGRYVLVTGIADANSPKSELFPCLLMDVTRVSTYPLLKPLPDDP